MLAAVAARGASLLPAAARVLDVGAGAAPGAWRGEYDLAIAGNLCHLFDEHANRRLLGRLRDALRPGGTLAVMDVIPDADEQPRPRWVALYELGLLLRTASGRVHPLSAYLGWLHAAGFERPKRYRLVHQAQAVLLVARKPAATEAGREIAGG